MVADLAAVALTYLAASVSFPQLIARSHGVDLHRVGTRNLGGANLAREVNLVAGISGALLDALKPPIAMLLAQLAAIDSVGQLACGVVAIAAQQWPIWHRFDGGRGNVAAMAFLIAISLRTALVVTPIALVGILWSVPRRLRTRRRIYSFSTPLGLLAGFAAYPLAAAALSEERAILVAAATTALIIIRRLTAGLRADLRLSSDLKRILLNRLLFDRTEVQRRALAEASRGR